MIASNPCDIITCVIGLIDKFIELKGVEERFSTLINENIEGDHFCHIWENLNFWFAITMFPVKSPSGCMARLGKVATYQCMKTVFYQKFPEHEFFRESTGRRLRPHLTVNLPTHTSMIQMLQIHTVLVCFY